ncbi:hypothetical protein NDU88_005900 [Pleurodeles waltl]|uniref:Uncharacterized protein n=1 Tax=Pleurodeles waltl TaxID=8319 RepID=A0AAV7TYI4_PLEWA|nr:hypothetical protein NDU88_005900 [Pleurodeles waltl]
MAGSRVVLPSGPSMVAGAETPPSLDTTSWCRRLLPLPPGVPPASGVSLVVLVLPLPPGVPPPVSPPSGVLLVVLVLPLPTEVPPSFLPPLCPSSRPPLLSLPSSPGLRREGLYEAPHHPEVDVDRFLTALHPGQEQ